MERSKEGAKVDEDGAASIERRGPSTLSASWSDLDDRTGVLDFRRAGLSLYVLRPGAHAPSMAWWTTDDGNWLTNVLVGLA